MIKRKGFSLLELLVVVTIVCILGVVAYSSYQNYSVTAKYTQRFSTMLELKDRVIKYAETKGNGVFNSTSNELGFTALGGSGEFDGSEIAPDATWTQISWWDHSYCDSTYELIYFAYNADITEYIEIDLAYVNGTIETVCHYTYFNKDGSVGTGNILPGCFNSLNYTYQDPLNNLLQRSCI